MVMVVRFMGSPVPDVKFDPIHTDSSVQALCCERPLAARKTLDWPEMNGERLIAVPRLALPPAHPMLAGAARRYRAFRGLSVCAVRPCMRPPKCFTTTSAPRSRRGAERIGLLSRLSRGRIGRAGMRKIIALEPA
jgi:hypothetical protein